MIIKDAKGRKLIVINDKGQIAISRYVDMPEKCKRYITDVYCKITGENKRDIMRFLNYKEKHGIYCS